MSVNVIQVRTQAEVALAKAFDHSKGGLPGDAGVAKWREDSMKRFTASGLPHRRVETWHYTDLRAHMRDALPLAAAPSPAALAAWRAKLPPAQAPRLVLFDGFFVPELSTDLPAGIEARSLSSVLSEGRPDLIALLAEELSADDPMTALNAALMQDGAVIEVAPGTIAAAAIHLIHISSSRAASFSRSAVIAGAGASVRLAESCEGDGTAGQANACLILSLADGAALAHTAMVAGTGPGSIRLETMIARLGAAAKFDSFALVSSSDLVRRQVFLRFDGSGAEASLSGVSLLDGRDHADTTLLVEHRAPACVSRETFRTIADEEATGVFQGKIHVAPKAQKTDARMLSRAVLLSDMAAMNNKPELEIFADDVVCGHGATCGGLDAEQLFYLQTRGLALADAEALLLEAFAGELINGIGHEKLTSEFHHRARAWLAARAAPHHGRERA